MRILLSAYACEPHRGSEPGVGWGWALAYARQGHCVTVLTRANNRESIDSESAQLEGFSVRFEYCDLPAWATWWKKGASGIVVYYSIWQWLAYRLAKRLHRDKPFDRVHHVTFASLRQPSFMVGLGVPFVFGPLAGGDTVPPKLLRSLRWSDRAYERWRAATNRALMLDPFLRRTFRQADLIYVTSKAGMGLLPKRFHAKAKVRLAIGWSDWEAESVGKANLPLVKHTADTRVLYVGALIGWKGVHLALAAFAQAFRNHAGATFTIVGEGSSRPWLKEIADRLGIANQLTWRGWLPRQQLGSVYRGHDIFLYPSLRDSGGMVVLEALASGLPVVCLDLAGPGAIVDGRCGVALAADDIDESEVVANSAAALRTISRDEQLRRRMAIGAAERVKEFLWERKAAAVEIDLAGSAVAEFGNRFP